MNNLELKSGLITVYNAENKPLTVKVLINTEDEELTVITTWADGSVQSDDIAKS